MAKLLPEKAFNKVVATEVAHAPQLYARAEAVKATALALAAAHYRTGAYASSIVVKPGNRVDVDVVATDPQAAHIEWGHIVRNPRPDKNRIVGTADREARGATMRRGEQWADGLHIMRNAAIAHGGKVG